MSEYTATWPAPRAVRTTIQSLVASIDPGVVMTIAVRVAMVVGAGLASVMTARWLSPSQRGEYFVVYTLAQGLAQFGNPLVATRP
jgi:hypothetical protein